MVTTRLLLASALCLFVGCAVDEPVDSGGGDPIPMPEEEEPAPMAVFINWNGPGFHVEEIAVEHFAVGSRVALQLVLDGTVTAQSGSTMKLRVNGGTRSWSTNTGLSSSDYASASCGSWTSGEDTLFGLLCRAPSGPTVTTTSWHYSESDLFDVTGTADDYEYSATFKIEVFDGEHRIECRKLVLAISRNTTLGGDSSFDNGPCESWE